MADTEENVKFGAVTDGLKEGAKEGEDTLEKFGAAAERVGDQIQKIGELIGVAFTLEKLKEFVQFMGELGEQTERTAEIFGISTQEVGLLGFAAQQTGGNAEQLIRSLERMSTNLVDVSGKATPTGAALKALGLNIEELRGLPLPEFLDKVRQRFDQLPAGMERTAIAQNLARQGAESLLPILSMSNDQWDQLRKTFDATGAAMDERRAGSFAGMEHALTTLQTAAVGLGERIMDVLAPGITYAAQQMTSFVESINAETVKAALNQIIDATLNMAEAVVNACIQAEGAIASLLARIQVAGAQAALLGRIALDVASTNYLDAAQAASGLLGAGAGLDASLAKINADTEGRLAASKAMFQSWSDSLHTIVNKVTTGTDGALDRADHFNRPGFKPGEGGAGTNPFGSLNLGGNGGSGGASDATAAARASIEGQLAVLRAGLDQKKQMLEGDLQVGKLTQAQYLTAVQAETNQEYQAEVALVQKELQLSGLKLAQRQELLNKLKLMEQQHATDILKIQQKAAEETRKAWEAPINALGDAINAQVGALVNGTESIGQALLNLGGDVATQLIQQAIKSITALAAQAFAGVFAHDAPTLGLAAAGSAAAGSAAVMAAAAGIGGAASAATGTWELPGDMPINAHKGEAILPRFESDMFRTAMDVLSKGGGAGQGGGTEVHFHGAVWDKQAVAGAVAEMFNLNPSLRPKY